MKNKLYTTIVLIYIISNLTSCKKSGQGIVDITYSYYFGDSILKPDVKYPIKIEGKNYLFRIDVMKMYLSKLSYSSTAWGTKELRNVDLFNYKNGSSFNYKDTLPAGDYNKLSFNIGLDSNMNNMIPNSFSINHPMSTAQSMYWGMVKYRFLVLEGYLYDSTGKEINTISYHTGVNLVKEKVDLKNTSISEDNPISINIKFNVASIFTGSNPINPTKEVFTHSNPGTEYDLANKVMENMNSGTTIIINP